MSAILDDLLSEDQLASELKRNPRTIKRWRDLREGPPHLRIGRSIYYRRDAVRQWLLNIEQGAAL